jgi:hypothetical protein
MESGDSIYGRTSDMRIPNLVPRQLPESGYRHLEAFVVCSYLAYVVVFLKYLKVYCVMKFELMCLMLCKNYFWGS